MRGKGSLFSWYKIATQGVTFQSLRFVYSRNTYTFTKIIFPFIPFPVSSPERGCETMSSLEQFPHLWHHIQSTLSLQNAWGSAEEKSKHTHTTLISSSQCSGRLLALSLAFAVMPSLSPRKFQCTPLPEAHLFKQVGTRISVLPKVLLQLNQQLQGSIKNVQWDRRNTAALSRA